MTPTERRAHWKGIISDWESSKLSQPAFCKERDIVYSQFCYWRYELNKTKRHDPGQFIPLSLNKQSQQPSAKSLTVCLPEGISIKIHDESQLSLAAKLLRALR